MWLFYCNITLKKFFFAQNFAKKLNKWRIHKFATQHHTLHIACNAHRLPLLAISLIYFKNCCNYDKMQWYYDALFCHFLC